MFGGRRRRREEELARLDRFRVARRLMDEEITVLGEQLGELHGETLADDLDAAARHHYGRALEHYEQAKQLLTSSTTSEEVLSIEQVLADARRLAAGEAPLERLVRVGDRWVPWHRSGGSAAVVDARNHLAGAYGWRVQKAMVEAHLGGFGHGGPMGGGGGGGDGGGGGGGGGGDGWAGPTRAQTLCSRRAASAIDPLIDG